MFLSSSPAGAIAMPGLYRRRSNQPLAVTVVFLALALIETVTHGEKSDSGLFQIDLMQYHHVRSPYAKPNLSLKGRIEIAVKSSQARATSFNQRMLGSIFPNNNAQVYQQPVSSNEGEYLTEVQIGSPPQTKIAIVYTGSDLFWLQCDCSSCYSMAPDPPYSPAASSTYENESCLTSLCLFLPSFNCPPSGGCEYYYGYGDGSSTQGVLASDVLTLGSSEFSVQFGCGQQNQGSFSGTDGLVGLGQGSVSIIKQIGNNFGSVFSYCLVSFYSSLTKTSPLKFGNSGDEYTYTNLIPNLLNPTFYYVKLLGILVNGIALNIPKGTFDIDPVTGSGGFILDSGTTISQLQPRRTRLYSPK